MSEKPKALIQWIKDNGKTDPEMMDLLGLRSINQWKHRLWGITPFTPLERRVLAEYAGVPEEELFEKKGE